MHPKELSIIDFTYELPAEKIAHHPAAERGASRLLSYNAGVIHDAKYTDLPDLLPADTLLVFNDTRVVAARLLFKKETGGIIEIFCLEPYDTKEMNAAMAKPYECKWTCLVGGASKWKHGYTPSIQLSIDDQEITLQARIDGRDGENFIIHFSWNSAHHFSEILQHAGAIPLPPYIRREASEEDVARYQTVYAREEGSVAAPTAGLHFTPELMDAFTQKHIAHAFVTLHVGAGTFKPVKADKMADHDMHAESFRIPRPLIEQLLTGKQVIPVGTTSMRTLESLYWFGVKLLTASTSTFTTELDQWEVYDLPHQDISRPDALQAVLTYMNDRGLDHFGGRTRIIIAPGYRFRVAKGLITNFHQPQSTLLLLVAALLGNDWRKIYAHALENGYRFLSYGDGSLLQPDAGGLKKVKSQN